MDENTLQILTEIRDLLRDGATPSRPWLSPEGAARYLGLSVSKIHKLVADGQIPFHRVPHTRMTKFHTVELDGWMRKGNHDSTQEEVDDIMRRLRK